MLTKDQLNELMQAANDAKWIMKPVRAFSEKTLSNAINGFAKEAKQEELFGFYNTTVLGSGKRGYLLTSEAIYNDRFGFFKDHTSGVNRLPLEGICGVEEIQNGKMNYEIQYESGESIIIYSGTTWLDGLMALLNRAIEMTKASKLVSGSFLYEDAGTYYFMDADTYEQYEATKEVAGHVILDPDQDINCEVTLHICGDIVTCVERVVNADQLYSEGMKFYKDRNYKAALPLFEEAANAGHAEAQYYCGNFYDTGKGVERNRKKAASWYEKAAMQGHVRAQSNLGACYRMGDGVPQDNKKAVYWYEKAALQGRVQAQASLATCYRTGAGVDKDMEKAHYWYEKAAAQGHRDAKLCLEVYF